MGIFHLGWTKLDKEEESLGETGGIAKSWPSRRIHQIIVSFLYLLSWIAEILLIAYDRHHFKIQNEPEWFKIVCSSIVFFHAAPVVYLMNSEDQNKTSRIGAKKVGILFIGTNLASRLYYLRVYLKGGPDDGLFVLSVAAASFTITCIFQLYLMKVQVFSYNPFESIDKHRISRIVDRQGSISIKRSSAFEIIIKNEGNEVLSTHAFKIKRTTFRSRKFLFGFSERVVEFKLPAVILKPAHKIKIIPETTHEETSHEDIKSMKIDGFRCFGFEVADEIRTVIFNRKKEMEAEFVQNFRKLGEKGSFLEERKEQSNKLWKEEIVTYFDQEQGIRDVVVKSCEPNLLI